MVGTLDAMRELYPESIADVEPLEAYADFPVVSGRPAVRLNMIVSVDGGTSWGGVSGALGGPADKALFPVLRSFADVVLVAAGTMRAEGYGPAKLPDSLRDARRARGQSAVPAIAVVSRSCRLDWDTPFFTEAEERPLVITVADAPDADRARAAAVADVIVAAAGERRRQAHPVGFNARRAHRVGAPRPIRGRRLSLPAVPAGNELLGAPVRVVSAGPIPAPDYEPDPAGDEGAADAEQDGDG